MGGVTWFRLGHKTKLTDSMETGAQSRQKEMRRGEEGRVSGEERGEGDTGADLTKVAMTH